MSKSINQVILMGNLTRDPELRQTPNGQNVVSFSLALNKSYKDKDGNWQEKADFVDCVAWAKTAEAIATYTSKGKRVIVQGSLQTRQWEQDGQKRSKTEVLANEVTFLDKGGDAPVATQSTTTSTASAKDDGPIDLNDIPF